MNLFQEVVAGDTTYSVANQPNLTVFDVHNDSPYNMGVSFGTNTGIQNADYYTSPHSILYGISPLSASQRSVGGVKWNGLIYIFTQTPMGGGTTNLASAPASQITIVGYPTGYQPNGTTSLSRLTNTGNPVNTVGGTATAIQNDNNTSGTSIVEATVAGDGASAISWTNDAVLKNGNATHPGSVSFDNAAIASDGAGNLSQVSFNGVWRSQDTGQGLSNSLNSVAAHVGTYNANALFPQSGASSTGLVFFGRDGSGNPQTALSFDPGATELEAWENVYVSGTITATGEVNAASLSTDSGGVSTDGSGDLSAKSVAITSGHYQFLTGTLSRVSAFSGTGSGTYNHNCGATPLWVGPIVHQSGSATQGFDSATSTQVHITLGASLAFEAFCIIG